MRLRALKARKPLCLRADPSSKKEDRSLRASFFVALMGSGTGDAEGLLSIGFVRDGIYRKFALKNEKIMDKNGSICEREKIKIHFTEMLDD